MSTLSRCMELSLSIVLCCSIVKNVFLMEHESLLECVCNAPSDSDGDLPPGYLELLERLPQVCLDIMSCPLLMEDLLLEVSFPLRRFCPLRGCLFIEYPLCGFLCCQTISHMQTVSFKGCKTHVYLELFF